MKQKIVTRLDIVVIVLICAAFALVTLLSKRAYHRTYYGQVKDGYLRFETAFYNLNLPESLADQIYVEIGKSQEKFRGTSKTDQCIEKNYRLDLYYEEGEEHIPVATLELYGFLQNAYSDLQARWLDMGRFTFYWNDYPQSSYSYLIFCWDDKTELTEEQTKKVQDLRTQIQKAAENIEVREGENKAKNLRSLFYKPQTPPKRDGMNWGEYKRSEKKHEKKRKQKKPQRKERRRMPKRRKKRKQRNGHPFTMAAPHPVPRRILSMTIIMQMTRKAFTKIMRMTMTAMKMRWTTGKICMEMMIDGQAHFWYVAAFQGGEFLLPNMGCFKRIGKISEGSFL